MARDPDTIQREIEQTQDALADTLNQIIQRAHPKRLVDSGKQAAQDRLADPKVRYTLIGVGAMVALVVVRALFR